jgi:Fuc2NAc and GlcNAc transferase
MSAAALFALTITTFLLSAWLTGWFRGYAVARLLDIPNERSSHTVATPRGGGIAIVIAAIVALVVAALSGGVRGRDWWPLVAGGLIVAAVGFVEDHRELARRWRLVAHFIAAACTLLLLGGLSELHFDDATLGLKSFGHVLAIVYLVWMINLTNFMDGTDGIAAVEASTVCVGGMLISALTLQNHSLILPPLVLTAAALGFLLWNWPPAAIFMGDVGSGFLGLMLGAFSLQAARLEPALFWAWLILLGVFVVDATVTLVRRALRGERFYEAHRSHAYQHMAQRHGHRAVALATGAINLFWLCPLAVLVATQSLSGIAGITIAYIPLIVAALRFGAGMVHSGR